MTFEVFQVTNDPGVGQGHRIALTDGKLVGQDEAAREILGGLRLRNPGLSDPDLAAVLAKYGWSNGWAALRQVPE